MPPKNLTLAADNPYGERYEGMAAHRHWDAFDMKLEGCRFNLLHDLLSRPGGFEDPRLPFLRDELVALAHSKGYADQDSHLNALEWDEEPKGYGETIDEDYEEAINASVNRLLDIPGVDRDWVHGLSSAMLDAVTAGRRHKGGSPEDGPSAPSP